MLFRATVQQMQGAEVEYRFQDVRVDTRAHRVTRGGVELALEPKAYQVLLQLLARPGAVLERDELLDAVWGHRHVTPAVLNRVIAMLRRELGDDADHPQAIRTVHGVGYSLIATVTTVQMPDAASIPAETPASARVETGLAGVPDIGDAGQPGIGASLPQLRDAEPPAATRMPRRMLAAALVLGVLFPVAWLWLLQTRAPARVETAPAPAVATPAPAAPGELRATTLAVLPISSAANDEELREIAAGLTDSFSEALARVADLRVTSLESTAVAVDKDRTPRAVMQALSVGIVLDGHLREVEAGNLELELKLFDASSPAPVWTHVVRHARAQPYRMLGPALDALATSPIREHPVAGVDPALNAALDAQDHYWLGRQEMASQDGPGRRRALAQFERALAIDPGFALALTAMSECWRMLALSGEEPMQASAGKALAAVERALQLDPNLTQAYVLKSQISTMQWRQFDARAAAQRAMELAPHRPDVLAINGNLEAYAGRPRAAHALHLRAQAANPLSPSQFLALGQDCLILGDETCARERYEEAKRIAGPRYNGLPNRRVDLAFGDIAKAAIAAPTAAYFNRVYAILDRAQAWSMLGLDNEAVESLESLRTLRSSVPLYLAVHMDRLWRNSRWADALAWAEGRGGDAVQEPWRSVWIAQARALEGDAAAGLREYDRALADSEQRALVTYSWFPTRIGIGQVANWIALRRHAGVSYQSELAAMNAEMAAMEDGGVGIPAFDYHRAVAAVLAGDTKTADARLGRAIERGWLDDVAFATDFAWRDYTDAPWLRARRAQIAERLAAEREIARAGDRDAAKGAAEAP